MIKKYRSDLLLAGGVLLLAGLLSLLTSVAGLPEVEL